MIGASAAAGQVDRVARLARVVVPNVPHHLSQGGNHREDVLFDDADRQRYLALLAEQAEAELRRHTKTGRPCGSDRFVQKLQALLGRFLTPAKRGRKPAEPARKRKPGAKKTK